MVWSVPSGSSGLSLNEDPWGCGSDSDASQGQHPGSSEMASSARNLGDEAGHGHNLDQGSLQPNPIGAEASAPLEPHAAGDTNAADMSEPRQSPDTCARSRSRSRTPTQATRSDIPRADREQRLCALRRLPQPALLPGTEWWSRPLWHAVEGMAATMPLQPKRAMAVESFCSGMATEAFGFKASRILSASGFLLSSRFLLSPDTLQKCVYVTCVVISYEYCVGRPRCFQSMPFPKGLADEGQFHCCF